MAYPQGIGFRLTNAYVTDLTNYDHETNEDSGINASYPHTTTQGNNVGWETSAGDTAYQYRDRYATNDMRIAGTAFNTAVSVDYRLDLSATGAHNIGLAAGDPWYSRAAAIDLYDTSSSLGSLSTGTTSAAQRFKDATDTEYTETTWPTSQTLVSKTFSTTICRFRLTAANVFISSLYVETGGAAPRRWIFGSNLLP